MGVEKKATTFRLDAAHERLIAQVGELCDPPSVNRSMNLRTLLNGVVAYLTTGRMPRWMADWQGVLANSSCTEEVGRIAARPVTSVKRPPRRLATAESDAKRLRRAGEALRRQESPASFPATFLPTHTAAGMAAFAGMRTWGTSFRPTFAMSVSA